LFMVATPCDETLDSELQGVAACSSTSQLYFFMTTDTRNAGGYHHPHG
jgi:hypothetical protein